MAWLARTIRVTALGLISATLGCGQDAKRDTHGSGEHDPHPTHANHGAHDEHEEDFVLLSPAASEHVQIRLDKVEARALSGLLTTTGRVDFNEDQLAHVAPRVPGRVHQVLATLGDEVQSGKPLAVIDSIDLGRAKSTFLAAKVQYQLAQQTLRREEQLLHDRITSEQSVAEARAAAERARASYQSAKQELRLLGLGERQINKTSADDPSAALFPLKSPIDGTIIDKHVSLGEVVSPERNLFTIADLSKVWIWIDIYERDLAGVHLEDDVAVRVDAFPKKTFNGKVAYIRNQVDPDTRTARARIDVTNVDGRLRPGMFATVTVTDPHGSEGEKAPLTLLMPASAVQRDGTEQIAFVPAGKNRYERRTLRLGRRTDAYIEVLAGLSAGESVVIEGAFLLKSETAKQHMGGGHSH